MKTALPRTRSALAALAALGTALLAASAPLQAAPVTECGSTGICYCMNSDFKPVIDAQVEKLRALIAAERAKGKAVGYLSIPLSTAGGGYFNLNREVAERTKQRVEARLGASSAWLLNPAMKEADIPNVGSARAGGAEYMVMWTRVLEGAGGLGEDFDFIYFTGPGDFAATLGLTGTGDLDRLGAYFEDRLKTDADLKRAVDQGRLTAQTFRNYYGLRASTNFSLGAHDEWNIAGRINAKRRSDPKFGVTNQLPTLYDGRAVSSAEADNPVATGYAGPCKAP
jgi:hypothetical protein